MLNVNLLNVCLKYKIFMDRRRTISVYKYFNLSSYVSSVYAGYLYVTTERLVNMFSCCHDYLRLVRTGDTIIFFTFWLATQYNLLDF